MTQPRSFVLRALLCLALAASLLSTPAAALSESICLNTAATWVTDSPRLEGQFPYYSMLFFCEGELNLENRNVDACINNGSNCGQAAADEFCQYMGFEANAPTLFTTTVSDGPARSMSGEWCIEAGKYQDLGYLNRTQLEAVNSTISSNKARCERLDSVVCYNSRGRLAQNNLGLHPAAVSVPESAPQPAPATAPDLASLPQSQPPPSQGSSSGAQSVAGPQVQLPPATAIGGRRHLFRSA